MRYMMLIYLDEHASAVRSPAEVAAGMAAHVPYIARLRANGHHVASDALAPASTATTLRTAAGKPVATQGPFAESREQLGGFYVIDAADLDDALAIATDCPALATVGIAIEIRPIPDPGMVTDAPGPGRYFVSSFGDVDGWPAYVDRAASRLDAAETLASPESATTLVRLHDGTIQLEDAPFRRFAGALAAYSIVRAADPGEVARLAPPGTAVEIRAIRPR